MKYPPMPTADYLRECFDYDPRSGVLSWKKSRPTNHFKNIQMCRMWHTRWAGTEAGNPRDDYRRIKLGPRAYLVHRLIWKIQTGTDPAGILDHRDCNPRNNVWGNLREATHGQNQQNRPLQKNNTSGVKGVSWDKDDNKWHVNLSVSGKIRKIGRYASIVEAAAAYCEAALRLHGEFARTK